MAVVILVVLLTGISIISSDIIYKYVIITLLPVLPHLKVAELSNHACALFGEAFIVYCFVVWQTINMFDPYA